MTIKRLCGLVSMWQGRLRLLDWDITVGIGDEDGCQGSILPDPLEQTAVLTVGRGSAASMEATVVHELLHLRLLPLWDGDCAEAAVTLHAKETVVNLLASCYLTAWAVR